MNMDSTVPVHPAIQRPNAPFPPGMGQPGFPPQMIGVAPMRGYNLNMGPPPPMGSAAPMGLAPPMGPIFSQKDSQFSKGIYVSGFENSLTTEMLEKHFKIKPIAGLKLPLTKHQQNKGFAFIYYNSPDDAAYVKETLDHTVILTNKIRVTKTVNAEHLSKMMFKLKTKDRSPAELQEIREKIFNEKNLEAEVSKIIKPLFGESVEVNKILIPRQRNSKDKSSASLLPYARGFFHISNIKQASKKVNTLDQPQDKGQKKDYQIVLQFIVDRINTHPQLSKYIQAQIYEYANKNKPNILHIKNIKVKSDEDPLKIAEELKNVIQATNHQANIINCYVAMFGKEGAWANVCFGSFDQVQAVYNYIKNNKVKFRDDFIFATIKNYKDMRTIVISTVQPDAKKEDIEALLNKVAERSPRFDPNDQSKGRKFDYLSFNVLEKKTFYYQGNGQAAVGLYEDQKPKEHWKEENTVPKRVVVHFVNDIQEKDAKQLLVDIHMTEGWQKVFFEKDSKSTISGNHQKGHIEGNKYVKHAEANKKKPQNQVRQNKPRPQNRKQEGGQYQFGNKGPMRGNAPLAPKGKGMMSPPIRHGQPPINRPMGGGISGMNPKMGQIPTPIMGGLPPAMGGAKPYTGIPPMGGNMPPMGGSLPPMGGSLPPMGGSLPPMGGSLPPMGGNMPPMGGSLPPMGLPMPPLGMNLGMQVPPMGAPKMGSVPPQNIPQGDKKQ